MLDLYTDTSKRMTRLPYFLWNVGLGLVAILLMVVAYALDPVETSKAMKDQSALTVLDIVGTLFVLVLVAPITLLRLNDINKEHSLYWGYVAASIAGITVQYAGQVSGLHLLSIIGSIIYFISAFYMFILGIYLTFKKGE